MASTNLFELLGDDDIGDVNLFLEKKKEASIVTNPVGGPKKSDVAPAKPAKLPSKPAPPSQAVREARNEGGRGGGGRGGGRGGRGGYGRERGSDGPNRDFPSNNGAFNNESGVSSGFKEDRERSFDKRGGGFGGPRGGFRGGRRGGFSNGEASEGERPRRMYDRHSSTGRSNDFKRDGAGRGNWGTPTDEITPGTEEPVAENEVNVAVEKVGGEEANADVEKEIPVTESEVKEPEPEEKQMTLEEYEKVLEEKRKALLSMKSEERKVDVDKEFESMQLVSKKKNDDEVFIKLGSEKDKRRDAFEKEEKAKKSVNITEFLKSGEGEKYYRGGRGRGRGGRGGGGAHNGGGNGGGAKNVPAPSIEDATQFPSLGGK